MYRADVGSIALIISVDIGLISLVQNALAPGVLSRVEYDDSYDSGGIWSLSLSTHPPEQPLLACINDARLRVIGKGSVWHFGRFRDRVYAWSDCPNVASVRRVLCGMLLYPATGYGSHCLHAAAVMAPSSSGVALLVGPSGVGKTTLSLNLSSGFSTPRAENYVLVDRRMRSIAFPDPQAAKLGDMVPVPVTFLFVLARNSNRRICTERAPRAALIANSVSIYFHEVFGIGPTWLRRKHSYVEPVVSLRGFESLSPLILHFDPSIHQPSRVTHELRACMANHD